MERCYFIYTSCGQAKNLQVRGSCANGISIDDHQSELNDWDRYEPLRGFDLQGFFAELLELLSVNVEVFFSGKAFLKGVLAEQPELKKKRVIALSIGTDISAAINDGELVHSLHWEIRPFLKGNANDYLSSSFLLKEYYASSEISLLNVTQLADMYTTHKSARDILKIFLTNLTQFISLNVDANHINTIVFGGIFYRHYRR